MRGETDSTSRRGGAAFQADTVIVSGTNGNGSIRVAGQAFGVSALGLAAQVNITWARPGLDRLTANALAHDNVVAASGLSADAIPFVAGGGAGPVSEQAPADGWQFIRRLRDALAAAK